MQTYKYSKKSSQTFQAMSEYLFENYTATTRFHCMATCNEYLECAMVTYSKDTFMCNLYYLPKNDSIYAKNTDVFLKVGFIPNPCLFHCKKLNLTFLSRISSQNLNEIVYSLLKLNSLTVLKMCKNNLFALKNL